MKKTYPSMNTWKMYSFNQGYPHTKRLSIRFPAIGAFIFFQKQLRMKLGFICWIPKKKSKTNNNSFWLCCRYNIVKWKYMVSFIKNIYLLLFHFIRVIKLLLLLVSEMTFLSLRYIERLLFLLMVKVIHIFSLIKISLLLQLCRIVKTSLWCRWN